MNENRIIELEIKLSYQEDLIESLNNTVSEQQQQINRLENSLSLLHQRQQSLAETVEATQIDNQPPPHY